MLSQGRSQDTEIIEMDKNNHHAAGLANSGRMVWGLEAIQVWAGGLHQGGEVENGGGSPQEGWVR